MNQSGSEILFAQSPKYAPRQLGLCGTGSLVKVHSEPGGQLEQKVDCRDMASGKEDFISI